MPKLPIVATAAILAILAAWWVVAEASAQRKLAAAAPLQAPHGSYRVTLDFAPERFHQLRLQDAGRMVEVRERDVYLMDVTPPALHALAREYWVAAVRPWDGR